MLWCGLGCTRRRLEQRVMETGSFFSGGNLNSTHHERIWCGNCISEWEKWIYFTKMVSFTERRKEPLRSHREVRWRPHL